MRQEDDLNKDEKGRKKRFTTNAQEGLEGRQKGGQVAAPWNR